MQFGAEKMHKGSKYVLFLDDDVRLHPGSIGALTAEMEKNPEVCLIFSFHDASDFNIDDNYFLMFVEMKQIFIQTGYPLDLPSGSLGSYCIYEYHMVNNYPNILSIPLAVVLLHINSEFRQLFSNHLF